MTTSVAERCEVRSKRTGRKNCKNQYALVYLDRRICEEHWTKLAGSKLKLLEALGIRERQATSGDHRED